MNLKDIKTTEMLSRLNKGEISVLEEFGAYKLKQEMKFAGALACFLTKYICLAKDNTKLRQRAIRVLKLFFPADAESIYVQSDGAVVIGFNHPSLGEIFRLLYLGFEAYPERDFLFPVNIPWYESLVPSLNNLNRLHITLVPMITPSTETKLNSLLKNDSEKLADVRYVKNMFERNYMRTASEFAMDKSVIVVAPSATRQEVIIPEHIHPTMTLLAHIIQRKNVTDTVFLPITVVKPSNGNRRFNTFRTYTISPCDAFSPEEVKVLSDRSRDFDYSFLKRIEDQYNKIQKSRFN